MGESGPEGKNVVVTGAGSGIDRAAALEFARRGAAVVVADIRADAVEVTVVLDASGTAITVIGASLTTPFKLIRAAVVPFCGTVGHLSEGRPSGPPRSGPPLR